MAEEKAKKNRGIFIVLFLAFVGVCLLFVWDMANRTSPPWEKRKETLYKYKIDYKNKKVEPGK